MIEISYMTVKNHRRHMESNLFPIAFPTEQFQVRRIEYCDEEHLGALRAEHNSTHSFTKQGEYIYISPMWADDVYPNTKVPVTVQSNPDVVGALIRHVFFHTFKAQYKNYLPQSFYPFRFYSRQKEHDLMADLLPSDLSGVLARKQQIEVQFRDYRQNGDVRFGSVINLSYRWIFDKTCKELNDEGFDPTGLAVLQSVIMTGKEGVFAPDETLIGVIESHDGEHAQVASNDGVAEYPMRELLLHKSKRNILYYLSARVGESKAERILEQAKARDETRLNAAYYFNRIQEVAIQLASLNYSNMDSFGFRIAAAPLTIRNTYRIEDPVYIFDYAPGATDRQKSGGLNNYGPYDSSTFNLKQPRFLVVCHKSNRNAFTNFAGALREGIPTSKYFKQGMVGKYRLHDLSFDFIELDNYSVSEYLTKIKAHVRERGVDYYHLAIIETQEQFKVLDTIANPYYQTKAYFLSVLRIPVQSIKAEHLRQNDNILHWTCDSVALQMYAKLRGTPWVLPSSTIYDHEIVIGIGSIMLRPNLFVGVKQERIVGIISFFEGDGKYILSNNCQEVPYEGYFDELLKRLRRSIKDVSAQYGWRDGDVIRIVFHIFKPIQNIEADVVQELMSEFPQFDIKFSFVTISESHPFLLFDKSNKVGNRGVGKWVPQRRSNWMLDENSCLVQLRGASEMRTARQGFSGPVLIRIHEKSTYQDLTAIVQQVYNFTHLSWRGFHPLLQPVTIVYSNLIAKHLTNLKRIDGWNPEILNSDLKFSKWFL